MQIKNIFFPLPIVVDIINEQNEEERKVLFFDQNKNTFLPMDSSISEENLNVICVEINRRMNNINKNIKTFEKEKLIPLTDLNKIPEFVQKVNEMREGHLEKFRKNQS